MLRLLTIPFAILAFAACTKDDELACTDLAAASVGVTVLDADGAKITDATGTFDAGDGPVACDAIVPGELICGFEVQGDITIVVSAPGFADQEHVVTVGADECHVIEEFLTVTLEPVDCTAEEVPAVMATVAGSGGEDLSDVKVEWGDPRSDGLPKPCDLQADGSWTCAPEVSGDVEVYASAAGHQTDIQVVTVPMDEAGCHPVTQSASFSLEYLAD